MWKRYLKYNSMFIGYLVKDWFLHSEGHVTPVQAALTVNPSRVNVLGVGVNTTSMSEAVQSLLAARGDGNTGYVCVTGAHGIMECQRDAALREIHNNSLMTVPDGMPTVWVGHEYGFVKMGRVYGPDLMLELCRSTAAPLKSLNVEAVKDGKIDLNEDEVRLNAASSRYLYPSQEETGALDLSGLASSATNNQQHITDKKCFTHFLYGATEETLRKLKANLEKKFPGIRIVGTFAPPFRPLMEEEELQLQQVVAACKPDFFWVGLSTPKQERFMFEHCANMRAEGSSYMLHAPRSMPAHPLEAGIMIGVGAAFDIHAGNIKDSPEWVKNTGLQWLHRLCKEPRRLWRRYLWIVPGFAWLVFLQVMGLRKWTTEE